MVKYLIIQCFFIVTCLCSSPSKIVENLLTPLLSKYERPVTILYIGEKIQPIHLRKNHVIVYWTQDKQLVKTLKATHHNNAVVLNKAYSEDRVRKLHECEHFDICILSPPYFFDYRNDKNHLADFTILLNKSKVYEKKKTFLKKNIWESCSFHKNYKIHSSFKDKYFIKPKAYSNKGYDRILNWNAGINLCTFTNLDGVYPSLKHIRDSIIEVFNPYTHFDFTWGNIIVQGLTLRPIDYDDTKYHGNSSERLKTTLEQQLKIKYQ